MATIFRRKIADQFYAIIRPFLKVEKMKYVYNWIPLSLKFSQLKFLSPHFEVSWKDIVTLQPELDERIHINTVMTYLRNQDVLNSDGITDISFHSHRKDTFVFTVDQEHFNRKVLMYICNKINVMADNSVFFKVVPPENIIIDFSSPNIAKPFHYGHFRSTTLGNYIANICKYIGHDVTKINYIGDWGMQYGILAVGLLEFGSDQQLQNDPLNHLFEIYKKANQEYSNSVEFQEKAKKYLENMENGNEEAVALWSKLKSTSLKELNSTYKRLNITFDEIHGESMYCGNMKQILDILLTKKIALQQGDGSVEAVVSLSNDQQEKVVLQKSDGTSLYLTRDIAAALDRRKKYHFDHAYYVVDSSQSKHFKILKNLLAAMGNKWASNINHIPFGRISNFSTRKGNVAFLSDILDEAKERILENMQNTSTTKVSEDMDVVADILGVSSLIINDFKVKRKKNYEFNWDTALNMKADSGVTLQYCHARLNSIKENCGVDLNLNCELISLVEPEAISLISQLARFEEVVYESYTELEPCIIVHYLFSLRNEIGRAIKALPVKGTNPYVGRARLLLFHASYLVLHKSFELLGITPLDKM